ncbi:hypothetical protein [Vibrio ziniensis]|uniref:Uncharacterized protein n=1 Tax=Vibrio ziniensis TaxID=2711221 RepID=A0A6G7CMP4_9VIBR|nr:hypothetical protein [Vibrio ziniensis]QIH43318.1 hypothetical protein G5S32_15030 [Vibrio ziniensis]
MNFLKKNIRLLIKLAIPIVVVYFIFCAVSKQATVPDQNASPEQVKRAVEYYASISARVFSPQENINLKLTQQNIDDVLTVASHMTPRTNVSGRFANSIGLLSMSFDIGNSWFTGYININCFLISGSGDGSIDYCLIGDVSVPGTLINTLINISINLFFSDQASSTIKELINNIQINDQQVILTATKNSEFKTDVTMGLKTAASIAKNFKPTNTHFPEPDVINEYLLHILETNWPAGSKSVSLSIVIEQAFRHAQVRSQYNDPRAENEAALWSIAIAFGNRRFAEIINVNTPEVQTTLSKYPRLITTLSQRGDLPLHFLYSAVMEILGNSHLSTNVGELKELHDANPGGSGFDFTDLAADKAGAAFSLFLTSDKNNAIGGQNLLSKMTKENLFFPDINELPAPIKDKEFDTVLGSTQSDSYKEINAIIDKKISELPLYR